MRLFALDRRGGWSVKALKVCQEVVVYSKAVLVARNQYFPRKLLQGKKSVRV